MLKTLLKKEMMATFRGFYYNQRKGTTRTKKSTILLYALFGFLMVGVVGGSLGFLGYLTATTFAAVGHGWMHFLMFGAMGLLLGTLGSAFSTFSGLYLAKDNDQLLAMPIPVGHILASRLLNVYLIGLLYSGVVIVPNILVWWIFVDFSLGSIVGGLVLLLVVSVLVMLLSCLLGLLVAKLSLKLKNKSFVTVLIALAAIGLYYFLYFKAQVYIRDLIENAEAYGASFKSAVPALALFGEIGEGNWLGMGIYLAGTAVFGLLVWLVLKKTFLGIATASASQSKAVYHEKTVHRQSIHSALLRKEFGRFTASANYMLNCGLGLLIMLLGGVALLVYGGTVTGLIRGFLGTGFVPVLLCALICMLNSMNDMTAPSVSLEGKSIWLPQSLPIHPWQALRAKLEMHLLLAAGPTLFLAICGAVVLSDALPVRLLFVLVILLDALLAALGGLFLNLKMPNLNWTNEIAVIKQSGAVAITLFGGWAIAIVVGGLYFLVGGVLGPVLYLGIIALIFAALDVLLYFWLRKKGAAIFAAL